MFRTLSRPDILVTTLAAAGILMVTMGARQSLGLFVSPLNSHTGLGITTISLALAVGQFTWGAIQPVAGAVADRYGSRAVLIAGLLVLALGSAITPFMGTGFGLIVSLGLLSAMGAGAGSFSVLIGAAAQRLPVEARGAASGVINAGGSFGQFIFAPILQRLIQSIGWMGALWAMALATLAALPLVRKLEGGPRPAPAPATHASEEGGLGKAIATAMGDRSYLLLHAGFFTCGFHIAFLVTHLPGEVDLCGLPPAVASWSLAIIGLANIFGSMLAGMLGARFPMKHLLATIYFIRSAAILAFLLLPKSRPVFLVFSFILGFTWLGTVPLTSGVVATLFGPRFLASLFGIVFFSHQVGAFFGAWLGGFFFDRTGSYDAVWMLGLGLSFVAGLLHLPIREKPVEAPAAATTA